MIGRAEASRLAASGATVVSGFFDPLLAWHARRLRELKTSQPLIVVIADPPRPILPARARAELVASLASVSYVLESRGELPELKIDQDLTTEDARRFDDLLAHVHARQQGASA